MPTEAGGYRPAPHPAPPDDLDERELPLVGCRGPWLRIYRRDWDPLFFGKTGLGRFDAPDQRYGVFYAATDFRGAFIETFGWNTGVKLIDPSGLEERELAEVKSSVDLNLVNLTGKGLARIGADGRLHTGAHAISQRWSLALFSHPQSPDGLLYRTRHDPDMLAVALYERVAAKQVRAEPLGGLAAPANAKRVAEALDHYGFGL